MNHAPARNPAQSLRGWLAAGAFLLALGPAPAGAIDGLWVAGNGSWASAGNWDSGDIADGAEDTAYFGILANAPANATVTLDGARTIGHLYFTDSSGSDNWSLNPGSAGPLTLAATLDTPSVTVALAAQRVTLNTVVAGANGLEKLGAGTLELAGTNTLTGGVLVTNGTLLVNGRLATDVTVATARLGGSGTILGAVLVQSGALAPGDSTGTLTLSNSLTLQPGSTTIIEVNATTLAHDSVQGMSSVAYGGTLVVSNLGGTPSLGQNFPIFSAASASGNFSGITPAPGAGLRWKFQPAGGLLSVVSSASQPVIAGITLAGSNLVLNVINGPPGATNYVLISTNVALPVTNWTRLATNVFDVSGNFSFTNAASPGTPQRFFRVSAVVSP